MTETEDTILARAESYIEALFPRMRANDRLTLHYLLNRSQARAWMDLYNRQEAILEIVDPLKAVGNDLDHIVASRLLTRNLGNYATGYLTFGRNAPTTTDIIVPAGTRCTAGQYFFVTTAEGTIVAGTLNVSITARAETRGLMGNVADYTITAMYHSPPGIDSVINPLAFTGGTANETDNELRNRYIDLGTLPGLATPEIIERRLVDLSTISEAKVISRGLGDVEVIVDDSTGIIANNDDVIAELAISLAGGCQASGCIAAVATPTGNIEPVLDALGDPQDCAGGFVWVRPKDFISASETFNVDYLIFGDTKKTGTVTIPIGTHRGDMIAVVLEDEMDRAISVPQKTFTGINTYDILLGLGVPGYLYNVPTTVTFAVTVSIVATDTPEANLAINVKTSLTNWLSEYSIGEQVEWSDLRSCATIAYAVAIEPEMRHQLMGTERPFIGINRITNFRVTFSKGFAQKDGDIIVLEEDEICKPGSVNVIVV